MKRSVVHLFLGVSLLCSLGCLGKQFKRDGTIAHEAIADMYTEQALSNLIRAYCNLPFVQLKYSDLLVQDQDTYTGNAGIDQTITTVRDLITPAFSRTLENAYSISGEVSRQRLMSFHADPI